MISYSDIIDKYFPLDTFRREIYLCHCKAVASLALNIVREKSLNLSETEIFEAAMLHDIGICQTHAPEIGCNGSEPYIKHGLLGGIIIRSAHLSETYARVAERHTGAGISVTDIQRKSLPLPPDICYMPETRLERLICYADKFYSKSGDMKKKDINDVIASMAQISDDTLQRFMLLHAEFSI